MTELFNPQTYQPQYSFPRRFEIRQEVEQQFKNKLRFIPVDCELDSESYIDHIVEDIYNKEAEEYRRIQKLGREQFERDVEDQYDFVDLPKKIKDKIHQLAWDEGNSYGYSEVSSITYKYVELAKLAFEEGVVIRDFP